ncbi:MAG: hypothetical protein EXQ79_03955 [Acidimicrobiia bacterium]|nr:hypothetical protein [Acidimicrobiia bacterium]
MSNATEHQAVERLIGAITADQRLLLRATLMAGAPAREAWDVWRATVVLDDVDGPSQRLLPLLARRSDRMATSDPAWQLIKGIYRHAWVTNQLLVRDAAAVIDALHARNVPVIVLKGGAMVQYLAGDWGARPMYDVDILVPPQHVDDALTVLADAGWVPQTGNTPEWLRWRAMPRRHSWGFDRGRDGRLDLHWHTLHGSLGPNADDAFWDDAETIDLGATKALALSPPDLLLHLLDHGTRGADVSPIQWIADATSVVRAQDTDAIARRLAHQARDHGAVGQVRACLGVIAELVEEPAAAALHQRLASARRPLIERLAELPDQPSRGRTVLALHHAARAVRQFGGGRRTVISGILGFARAWMDLALARHRAFVRFHAVTGRSLRVAAVGRRVFGSFVRTPHPNAASVSVGTALDFSDGAVTDRYAGPGWYWLTRAGIDATGREARLVFDVDEPGALTTTLHAARGGDGWPAPTRGSGGERAGGGAWLCRSRSRSCDRARGAGARARRPTVLADRGGAARASRSVEQWRTTAIDDGDHAPTCAFRRAVARSSRSPRVGSRRCQVRSFSCWPW